MSTTRRFGVLALSVAVAAGCGEKARVVGAGGTAGGAGSTSTGELDASVESLTDMPATGDDLSAPWVGPCSAQHPCEAGRCFESQCLPDNGACTDDNECQNDTWCYCAG